MDNDSGLSPEIEGVSSPDSLLIKAVPEERCLQVVSAVEYKSITTYTEEVKSRIVRQHAHYTPDEVRFNLRLANPQQPDMPSRLGRLIHKLTLELPALPLTVSPQMSVVYVVPKDSLPLGLRGVEPKPLPIISSSQISALTRLLPEALS